MDLLDPLTGRWELALFLLLLVMGSLLWRGHRATTALSRTAALMHEQLTLLSQVVDDIQGKATSTEHTLVTNLAEYRMSLANTSAYREYLRKLGVAPGGDLEPILESIPEGAMAVGKDGRILYVNRILARLSGLAAGLTIPEMVREYRIRTLHGDPLASDEVSETRVLTGDEVHEELIRLRPKGREKDVILLVNGTPVRDAAGHVVAAVMVTRGMTEEVALAVEVRKHMEAASRVEEVPVEVVGIG